MPALHTWRNLSRRRRQLSSHLPTIRTSNGPSARNGRFKPQTRLNSLRSLDISVGMPLDGDSAVADRPHPHLYMPVLRTATMHGCFFPIRAPRLKYFKLMIYSYDMEDHLPWDRLRSILDVCRSRLSKLVLDCDFRSYPTSQVPRQIQLTALASLVVGRDQKELAAVRKHIVVPDTCVVS